MPGSQSAAGKFGVLFISSAEQPGADTFIHMLIMRSLDRARFNVHVAGPAATATPGYQALAAIPDVRLRAADFGPSLSERSPGGKLREAWRAGPAIASFIGLVRYVRANNIRVLHSTDRPRDAMACAVLGKLSGATSIVHAHLKCAEWMSRPLRWAMGQADALMGVSRFVVGSLVASGYESSRTYPVLNAIDLPVWNPSIDGSPVRREFGIPDGASVIASAARLFKGKGQDDVIRALPAVVREFPDVRAMIIGRDDLQAMRTSFTAELKALAADLGVANNVIFTGQRSDMPAVMAACDVFALPSDEEPFGLVYVEAMAMKRPVVALDNGGAPEIVEHGKSGLLSPPGDIAALSNNLLMLLRDPALRARMGEYGRAQAEARFSARRLANDVARVYEGVTGALAAPPAPNLR